MDGHHNRSGPFAARAPCGLSADVSSGLELKRTARVPSFPWLLPNLLVRAGSANRWWRHRGRGVRRIRFSHSSLAAETSPWFPPLHQPGLPEPVSLAVLNTSRQKTSSLSRSISEMPPVSSLSNASGQAPVRTDNRRVYLSLSHSCTSHLGFRSALLGTDSETVHPHSPDLPVLFISPRRVDFSSRPVFDCVRPR